MLHLRIQESRAQTSFADTGPAQMFLRTVTTFGLPEDRNAARHLWVDRRIGLHPLAGWRVDIVALVSVLAVAAYFANFPNELIAAIIAAGAFIVAYVEWMLGRRESSMDKFYERLEIANEHRSNLGRIGMKMNRTERYVFTELDNLEYVIERYRFGYMSPGLARRGVDTFISRLEIRGFKDELRHIMGKECAYNDRTCNVVRALMEQHDLSKGASSEPAVLVA